jgi:hypothetical protein
MTSGENTKKKKKKKKKKRRLAQAMQDSSWKQARTDSLHLFVLGIMGGGTPKHRSSFWRLFRRANYEFVSQTFRKIISPDCTSLACFFVLVIAGFGALGSFIASGGLPVAFRDEYLIIPRILTALIFPVRR